MSAKHTPGPWVVTDRDGLTAEVHSEKGGYICTPDGATVSEQIDNALLIAAAPCLFNAAIDGEGALRAAAAIMETQGHRKTAERFADYAENLRKATSKATGEGEA